MADDINIENMSDDDFESYQANLDESTENEPAVEVEQEVEETIVTEEVAIDETTEEVEEEVIEETVDTEESVTEEQEIDGSLESEVVEETVDEESQDTSSEEFDYKSSYEAVLKPLKVSGKDVDVKSIDDLRSLANMGIDYSRKMRDIKPMRAVNETLVKAGIIVDGVVNEEMLTRLIDINGGNKDAIASLLSEHQIDPLDMDTEKVDYVSESTIVSQDTIAIQDVQTELVNRGSLDAVISSLDRLDKQSQGFFSDNPSNLLKLEEDVANGSFDTIMNTVNYERSLNRLGNKTDMEAYVEIAQAMSTSAQPETVVTPTVEPIITNPNLAKRKGAGISKRAPAKKTVKTYDYANMSDEEFEKLTPNTNLY